MDDADSTGEGTDGIDLVVVRDKGVVVPGMRELELFGKGEIEGVVIGVVACGSEVHCSSVTFNLEMWTEKGGKDGWRASTSLAD